MSTDLPSGKVILGRHPQFRILRDTEVWLTTRLIFLDESFQLCKCSRIMVEIHFHVKVLIKLMFFEFYKQKEHLVLNVFYFNSDLFFIRTQIKILSIFHILLCTQKSFSVKTHNIVFREKNSSFLLCLYSKRGNQNEPQMENEWQMN